MSSARSTFRFVVDGITLTQAQQVRVATAIQQAGLEALNEAVNYSLTTPLMVGHLNPALRPEWLGMWVMDGPGAQTLGTTINNTGFYQ